MKTRTRREFLSRTGLAFGSMAGGALIHAGLPSSSTAREIEPTSDRETSNAPMTGGGNDPGEARAA